MSNIDKKEKKNIHSRLINYSSLKTYELFGQQLSVLSKREVRTWKALTIIAFFAGILVASIYTSAYHLNAEAFSFLPSFLITK